MERSRAVVLMIMTIVLSGCVTVTPAPGSDKVHVTRVPQDVAACKPVGNIAVPKDEHGLVNGATAATEFRNLAIGLGGNAAFVTSGIESIPLEGIAYRCE